ncbi:epoxide hydrolase family protein [Neorhizobium alkalisoli]|uniref:Pimeloyl-ACP methyl ester carboxylesterase n=1 Tax=Neorhizobium alkalisoli TaxID=528178 RepID=A0A561QVP0_9HYPH|nr:epoxide hydrolase family protein [Neorhizobium alkalisoli]TWF54440.1 pimeloyl-ACP methyl ester carboxylesterase [Neorhizobium alkalisoli]
MGISPFRINVPDEDISDLKLRLARTRWPNTLDAASWEDGTSLAFLQKLVHQWSHRFDWRAEEARLNQLPHFKTEIAGLDIHFIHKRGTGPAPMPLVLTHGWPGSFTEFERIIPLLTDPGAHGGDPADAFDVVVPSLPGYGFSSAPLKAGTGSRAIAGIWHDLMTTLGYRRFGAQGGDIGAGVSTWLARLYPADLIGVHLNYVSAGFRPTLSPGEEPTQEESAYQQRVLAWSALEGAYSALHATKPQTLAFALTDSPVGLAAWIAEKFRAWSDCNGDLESIISLDTLLTDISIYWFSGNLDSALRLYKENRLDPLVFDFGERLAPSFGIAHFPKELPIPPQSWVERVADVTRWSEMPAGGHFAALEQPQLLAEEIRAFFRPLR